MSFGDTPRSDQAEIVLRPFESRNDYEQCVKLQFDPWGHDFTECVPVSILQISQKVGGVAVGAFDADEQLIGFVYGISGLRDGRPAHWSHMLAVYPEYRGTGIGRRLKALQRELLLAAGIDVAFWTYDPLMAGNAHLNINLLGARPIEYIPDMYGSNTGSELHSGLGTDRFVVEWKLDEPQVERILRGEAVEAIELDLDSPTVDAEANGEPVLRDGAFPTPTSVRVAIPLDIQSIKRADPDSALTWRAVTRQVLLWYMDHDYAIVGFGRDQSLDRGYYYLSTGDKSKTRP